MASQIYAFILLYMTTTLILYFKVFIYVDEISDLKAGLKYYNTFFILHQIYAKPAAIACGASLTVGFILSVMLAVVGLQGFGKFPHFIYLYSETVEVIILLLVYILLPKTFQVYETSKSMIQNKWKRELNKVAGWRRSQLRRQVKAARPVFFGFYGILKVTRNWGVAYIYSMINHIMNACLSLSLDGKNVSAENLL